MSQRGENLARPRAAPSIRLRETQRPEPSFAQARAVRPVRFRGSPDGEAWLLDPSHPFYDQADVRFFTAQRDGVAVGRAAAVIDHQHNRRWEERDAFLGFFESVDDPEVAEALLEAVEDFVAERGQRRLLATLNPSANYSVGVQVEGFDEAPVPMLDPNPPYYAALLEGAGYEALMDWTAVRLAREPVSEALRELRPLRDEAVAAGTRFEPLPMAGRDGWGETVRHLYNRSFDDDWGFVPMGSAEFEAYLDHLTPHWLDGWSFLATGPEGPTGFIFASGPPGDGPDTPPAHIQFLCVAPSHRKSYVGIALAVEILEAFLRDGRAEAEFHSNDENPYMSRLMASLGARKAKTYRLYAKGDPGCPSTPC